MLLRINKISTLESVLESTADMFYSFMDGNESENEKAAFSSSNAEDLTENSSSTMSYLFGKLNNIKNNVVDAVSRAVQNFEVDNFFDDETGNVKTTSNPQKIAIEYPSKPEIDYYNLGRTENPAPKAPPVPEIRLSPEHNFANEEALLDYTTENPIEEDASPSNNLYDTIKNFGISLYRQIFD